MSKMDYINKVAPSHDKTSCSDENPSSNARYKSDDFGGCYRCTLLTAADTVQQPDIQGMVNRFLGWKLPTDFCPDCGINFDGRKDDDWNKNKTWPIGTNLFTADQAKAMFEYCLAKQSAIELSDGDLK